MRAQTSAFQLLEPLRPEERAALKADIDKRGILVPAEVDEETGELLDGHHRADIAQELGIDLPTISRRFETDEEKVEHVLKINLLRRHLGPVSWAKAFEKLAEVRGIPLGHGKGDPTGKTPTADVLAKELGVRPGTARERRRVARELASHPDLAEKVDTGEQHAKRALRVAREREAQARKPAKAAPLLPASVSLVHSDFRELTIEDSSVDLIFTDPPYPKEFLGLWNDLGKFAERVLKPSGLLVAYSGQYHLPSVLSELSVHLEYFWTGALVTPGQHNQVQRRHVRSACKPLLFFSKLPAEPGPWFDDVFISEKRDKDKHEWQQSEGAARYFVERLTEPGHLVCDPFLGSGTTASAANDLGRSFIGCDVEASAVETARQRFA